MINLSTIKDIRIKNQSVLRIWSGEQLLWEKVTSLLPKEYQQLEYIDCTGTQYFDTGVRASDYPGGIKYLFRGQVHGYKAASNNNYLFGCLDSSKRSGNVSLHTTQKRILVYLGGSSTGLLVSAALPELNTDFELFLSAVSTDTTAATATLDGTALTRGNSGTKSDMPSANIYLFYCSGVGTASQPFWGRFYSFTMDKPDGTPIRSFIPCRRKADSVIGVYDTVSNTFFTNIGTGSFAAGPEV